MLWNEVGDPPSKKAASRVHNARRKVVQTEIPQLSKVLSMNEGHRMLLQSLPRCSLNWGSFQRGKERRAGGEEAQERVWLSSYRFL